MSEIKLDQLFQKAREEAPTTSIAEVQKWIGYSAALVLFMGLLQKLKILTLKGNAMYATIIGAVGMATVALVYSTSAPKIEEKISYPEKRTQQVMTAQLEDELDEEAIDVKQMFISSKPIFQLFEMPLLPLETMGLTPLVAPLHVVSSPVKVAQVQGQFNQIVAKGMFTLVIEQGEESGYRAEGDYNHESLVVRLDETKNELTVSYNFKSGKQKKKGKKWVVDDTNVDNMTFYITVKELKKLDISGIVKVQYSGKSEINRLDVSISGISTLRMNTEIENLTANLSAKSTFIMNGDVFLLDADISGMAQFTILKPVVMNRCKINTSGMAKVKLELEGKYVELNNSGASEINLKGTAKIAEIKLSGSANVKAENLLVEILNAELSGASILSIYCSTDAKINASGASSLRLGGFPFRSIEKITGAASVKYIKE